jgi:hypothetical protein
LSVALRPLTPAGRPRHTRGKGPNGGTAITHPLLELFDSLAKRPALYVGTVSFATVRAFLSGLATGCRYAGIEYTWDDYLAAAEARGWDPRGNIGIVRDFRRKGLSEEDMVRELIAVERDTYARVLARVTPSAG